VGKLLHSSNCGALCRLRGGPVCCERRLSRM
jgi:hypothetical protein